MKNIEVLDCTLRDGGRIIDCKFKKSQINGIIKRLVQAKIDNIELGFLRNNTLSKAGTTFFKSIDDIKNIISAYPNQRFTLFIDYGLYDIEQLSSINDEYNLSIRYGFTRKQFLNEINYIKKDLISIKQRGYKLYIQTVNTIGYTDKELLDLISIVNEISPYSFGIVDTYGAMYEEDFKRLFSLIDFNLNSNIAIDFHGHNNMQMAFALSQLCVKLCINRRNLIIDSTLDGMGKCAGNLNTELITNYLNVYYKKDYIFDYILDAIDEYIISFKNENNWGYSTPSFLAGIYKAHPNNIIYLTNKFRIATKDIRKILSLIDKDTRQIYNYENIKKIYISYFSNYLNDENTIDILKKEFTNKQVLVISPGSTVEKNKNDIEFYINKNNPIVISVNFIYEKSTYVFFGNDKRYQMLDYISPTSKVIITSNVEKITNNELVCNFVSCIADNGEYFDNSTLMLLNLLQRCNVKIIRIAGMDGFSNKNNNYFEDNSDIERKCEPYFEEINRELEKHIYRYIKRYTDIDIGIITPSRFETVIKKIDINKENI